MTHKPDCLCCQHHTPTQGPRLCPICGYEFKGKGWDGIDAHWKSRHEDVMSYDQFWASLCPAHRGTHFTVADPEFHKRMQATWKLQGFMHLLGVEMTELEPGRCELELPYRNELSQQHGYFAGGVIATLADVASGYAAYSLTRPDASMVTVEFKVNFITPAQGDRLIARGCVIKSGKTLTVCQCDVACLKDGVETACATALATFITLAGKAEAGQAPG